MIFAAPLWLWALLALPLLVAGEALATRRDRSNTSRLVSRSLWARVLRRRPEHWRFVRLSLLLVGVAGIVLALARPQWGIVREKVEREGVDVVLALDTSGSMGTEDVAPNRFFLARAALASLVARLEGDRFGLLAFEGEAYPLVPLTLDADAVGLFLETLEPGIVPAPGSSIGVGLAKGIEMFVDKGRRNKVLVLVSDGEDLEGEVDSAVARAKEAGVVVHTVGVGSERGAPVPQYDQDGRAVGFKKDEQGAVVVSRLHVETLEAIARGTGGRFFRITGSDSSLTALAALVEGLEEKAVAREYSYRRKERFQVPLAAGMAALAAALLLPLPLPARRGAVARAAALAAISTALATSASAEGRVTDELLLKPKRLTDEGRRQYTQGDHPAALKSFESAAASRPADSAAAFNLADALYKNGKYDEAAALFSSLGGKTDSGLAGPARYNLGNSLFQKQDFQGAVRAYRDALRLMPGDADTRRNLELALRELKRQQDQQKQKEQDQQKQKEQQDQKQQQDQQQKQDQKGAPSPRPSGGPSPSPSPGGPPQTPEERAREKFEKEAGMPRDRAMQLLEALQQNEKAEQKRLLAEQKKKKKGTKDW
jgi:Ca-activated chloride channel family protein